jgi:hypothetical protein
VGDLGLTHADEFIEAMDKGGASICQPDISSGGWIYRAHEDCECRTRMGKAAYHTRVQNKYHHRCQSPFSRKPLDSRTVGVLNQQIAFEMGNDGGKPVSRQ